MKNVIKRLAIAMVATSLTAIGGNLIASAYYDSNSYASFEWDNSSCTIKNITNIDRYMTACFEVYEKNTGKFIDSSFSSNTGTYGATTTAYNPTSHSSMYNYIWRGAIYNGNHPYSGVAASFAKP